MDDWAMFFIRKTFQNEQNTTISNAYTLCIKGIDGKNSERSFLLPEDTVEFIVSEVRVIILENLSLKSLPKNINKFENIEQIVLKGNEFCCEDIAILISSMNISHLECLDLSNNRFTILKSGAFNDFSKLTCLILSKNKIKEIDNAVFLNLKNLQKIDLSENVIEELKSETFMDLKKLDYLDLSQNKIKCLEKQVFIYLPRLYSLNLSQNPIQKIKKGTIVHLTSDGNYLLLPKKNLEDGESIICFVKRYNRDYNIF